MKPLFLLLALVFLIGLVCMPNEEYRADPMVMRAETIQLITADSLAIPVELATSMGDKGQYFVENEKTHLWYSKYGVLNGFIFIPPLLLEKWIYGDLPFASKVRLPFLNGYNLILTLATATYLFLLVRRYTKSIPLIFIFIFSAFYCTFWWNYLRAQNSEIYQTLFLLAFFFHLTSAFALRDANPAPAASNRRRWHLLFAGLFLGTVILVKSVYIVVVPIAGLCLLAQELLRPRLSSSTVKSPAPLQVIYTLLWFSLPLAVSIGLLLAVNAHQFGSPFEAGYSQWGQEKKPVFSGPFFSGFFGFFFDIQYGMPVCFPILVFAIMGYRKFLKSFPFDGALALLMFFTMLILQSRLLNWQGIWGYGPRYMLSVLPLASLPFIYTLEYLSVNWRRWWAMAGSGLIALVLLYSFSLQLKVNALPFFTFYEVQGFFQQFHMPEVDDYFNDRPFGMVNGGIEDYLNGDSWEPIDLVAPRLSSQNLDYVHAWLAKEAVSNYYFFSGPDLSTAVSAPELPSLNQ